MGAGGGEGKGREAPAGTPSVMLPRTSLGQRATVSRGRNRARSGNGTLHVPFPSSQVVKATPWLCQESTCSPPNPPQKILRLFLGTPWEEGREKWLHKLFPRAKPRFCAAGLNLPLARGLLSNKDKIAGGRKGKLKSTNYTPRGICFAQRKKFVKP